MQTNKPPLRKHADFHLREWTRERMDEQAKTLALAALAKLVIGLGIMAGISTFLFFMPFMGGGGRRGRDYDLSASEIPDSLMATALLLAIGVPVVGFIVQIFIHHKQYHVVELQSGKFRYTDHISWAGDDREETGAGRTILGFALIGPWLILSSLETLLGAFRLKTGDADGVADVLGAMAMHRRISLIDLEHEYPGRDFLGVLRAVHHLSGVHYYRREGTSIALSNDLRNEIEGVIHP